MAMSCVAAKTLCTMMSRVSSCTFAPGSTNHTSARVRIIMICAPTIHER